MSLALSVLGEKAIALHHNIICTNAHNEQKLWEHRYLVSVPLYILEDLSLPSRPCSTPQTAGSATSARQCLVGVDNYVSTYLAFTRDDVRETMYLTTLS